MKKQIVTKIKETHSSSYTKIKLNLISWLSSNMLNDIYLYIESQLILLYLATIGIVNMFIRWKHSLKLYKYIVAIYSIVGKNINNLTGSSLEELHHKDK